MNEQDILNKSEVLISQKKYDEARILLSQIPQNKTAQDWLKYLNDIADSTTFPGFPTTQTKTNIHINNPLLLLVPISLMILIVLCIGVFAGIYFLLSSEEDIPSNLKIWTTYELDNSTIEQAVQAYRGRGFTDFQVMDKEQCETQWGMAEYTWLVNVYHEDIRGEFKEYYYYIILEDGMWQAKEMLFVRCP